jgi:L-threonylcarbamoyladenylate synthase
MLLIIYETNLAEKENMRTRVLKATLRNVADAARIVRKGGLVVYPTDTVYGLGCDPFNTDAVKRLIRAKGSRDKPLPILAHCLDDVEQVAELSGTARRMGERFWPGPLTLVLLKKDIPDVVTLDSATVGVRIPDHRLTLRLIELSGGLLVGTSANKAGLPPSSTASEAYEQLRGKVDVVLDGGNAKLRVSSTVLDLTSETPKVLREGLLKLENLFEEC